MNIQILQEHINTFTREVVDSGFKRDLDDYIKSLPASQNNIVALREIAEKILSFLDYLYTGDLPDALSVLLPKKEIRPFTEVPHNENLRKLFEDKEIMCQKEICSICKKDVLEVNMTKSHIIPKQLFVRGRRNTSKRTCRNCNNIFGSRYDASFCDLVEYRKFLTNPLGYDNKAYLQECNIRTENSEIDCSLKDKKINVWKDRCHPENFKKFKDDLEKDFKFTVMKQFVEIDSQRVGSSIMHSSFLYLLVNRQGLINDVEMERLRNFVYSRIKTDEWKPERLHINDLEKLCSQVKKGMETQSPVKIDKLECDVFAIYFKKDYIEKIDVDISQIIGRDKPVICKVN